MSGCKAIPETDYAAAGAALSTGPSGWTVIDDFESTTGRTVSPGLAMSLHTGSRKVLHTGALRLQATGSNNNPSTTKTAATSADPANWGVLALCVDFGTDVSSAYDIQSLRPTLKRGATSYAYQYDATVTGATFGLAAPPNIRGKRWLSFAADRFRQGSWGAAQFKAQGAGSTDIQINPAQQHAYGADTVLDAMTVITNAQRHKPIFMLTFDDNNNRQFIDLLPAMQSRGLVGSLYVPWALIGTPTRMTLTQLHAMQAAGFAMCLDSGPLDQPLTGFPSVAAAVSQLNTMKAQVAAEFGSFGVDHLCYSFGIHSYGAGPVTRTITGNGTNGKVTIAAPLGYSGGIAPGMYVRGTGIPAGTTVISCDSPTSITLSKTIPSSAISATFYARARGQTVTANGTTAVTVSSTTDVLPGMEMIGYSVLASTTVVGVNSPTQLTMSKSVPSTCLRANFELKTAEFWGPKMQDALLAAGYKSGRNIQQVGGVFTGFGIDPQLAINMPGQAMDTSSTALCIANFETALAECADLMCYGHINSSTSMTNVNVALDWLHAKQSAGLIDVLSVPDWHNRVSLRPGIS